ncbi:MAG TPA: YbhB/YbcL family Raf kinase inhibitor-like protein [Usitatibacter sp.]|nr:YbhB/YbcL family Raf kinase inhibitor-like protein [Usitatibacter sp.]
MKLNSSSFSDGGVIPAEFAFCAPDPKSHATLSKNHNPQLAWVDVPVGTKSFAIICHDPDVPSQGDDVNQEGRVVPKTLPRVDFFHWVVVDLPASTVGVTVGEFSSSVVPRGKPGPQGPHGCRQGINDYTAWFAGDKDMGGDYYGYDGPCPPWNDELPHRYVFTLYALDVEKLPLQGRFGGKEARVAVQGHVLGQASLTGRYSLNPSVKL